MYECQCWMYICHGCIIDSINNMLDVSLPGVSILFCVWSKKRHKECDWGIQSTFKNKSGYWMAFVAARIDCSKNPLKLAFMYHLKSLQTPFHTIKMRGLFLTGNIRIN